MATRPGVRGLRKHGLWSQAPAGSGVTEENWYPEPHVEGGWGNGPSPPRRDGCRWAGGRALHLDRESVPCPGENKSEEVRGHGSHFKNRQSGFHLLDSHATGWAPRPWNLSTGVTPTGTLCMALASVCYKTERYLFPLTPGRDGVPGVTIHTSSVLCGTITSWEGVSVLRGKRCGICHCGIKFCFCF